jgi:hypothetical protein
MDVFKLAFETTVVGLLTIGWLRVVTLLLFPDFQLDSALQKLPDLVQKNLTAAGIGALLLAYCLGSAILPIANQLVNDEHWPLNESAIRCQVFTRQQLNLESIGETALPALPKLEPFSFRQLQPRHCSYWAPVFTKESIGIGERVRRFLRRWVGRPINPNENATKEELTNKDPEQIEELCRTLKKSTTCDEFNAKRILTIFQQQETAVLNQPSDRTEGLRQLHERIVVLRGTIFSLFVLLLICLFAYFARVDNGASHWMRPACGIMLGIAFTVFGGFNGYQDLKGQDIFDIPVLESLLVVISIFGVVLAYMKTKNERFQSKRYVLITLFFTGLAYGGWMWSEIIYDQQVISSFVALQHPPASKD